ncbi:MAG TPA: beta-propeller domain-containing protein [Solimonas sp.]|nr:beta-propeller domain-containing protein [Solimonas sp.]
MASRSRFPSALLCLSLLLGACGGGGGGGSAPSPDGGSTPRSVPTAKLALKHFSGSNACADYRAYASESFTDQFLTGFRCLAIGPCPVFLGEPAVATDGSGAGATPPPGAAPERVSQTNTQEAGVDEADVVKADSAGNLYILGAQHLVALRAFPPAGLDSRPQTLVDLAGGDSSFYAQDFLLDEAAKRLIVFGSSTSGQRGRSLSILFDLADPLAPREVERLWVDGWPMQTRRVGNRVHRLSRLEIPLPASIYEDENLQRQQEAYFRAQSEGRDSDAARIREDVRSAIAVHVSRLADAELLPQRGSASGTTTLACSDIARPEVQTGFSLAVLESYNSDGSGHAASAAINNAFISYASGQNLYLAQGSAGWFFDPAQVDESVIYRFALSATAAPAYRGFGRVPGSLPGSYALSEHLGALRVASTETRFDSGSNQRSSASHLSVLRIADQELPLQGKVTGFAPGETIQGVRFDRGRGYVVTFRRIDPLFAFDLSDPAAPRVASELKLPGFSSYLMPLGDDHLLTIGRGGDDEQLNGQVAIQLFDVRNLAAVRQVAVIEPAAGNDSYSYSVAEYDPHAFTYFSDAASPATPGNLSIPLQVSDSSGSFTGFLSVRVDPQATTPLRETGRIDHSGFAREDGGGCSSPPPGPGGTSSDACFAPVLAVDPRRSVFMQGDGLTALYTVSTGGIKAHAADDPGQELGSAALPEELQGCCGGGVVSTAR